MLNVSLCCILMCAVGLCIAYREDYLFREALSSYMGSPGKSRDEECFLFLLGIVSRGRQQQATKLLLQPILTY